MRHGSLFSGIGGFDLASEWMGWENIFQVEWDAYCQKVLAKNFPKVTRYEDIKKFKGIKGTVDIITGGFPCQPFSQAGKRKGTEDDRYLWPEMLRVIREVKPSFVVGENVAGLLSMENGKTFERILTDLEDEGYEVESFVIPACATEAWHRRDRIWILAYACNGYNRSKKPRRKTSEVQQIQEKHREKLQPRKSSRASSDGQQGPITNTDSKGLQATNSQSKAWGQESSPECDISGRGQWQLEPSVGRVAHGVPKRMDRLKGLGNSVVPQVALEIFKCIDKIYYDE